MTPIERFANLSYPRFSSYKQKAEHAFNRVAILNIGIAIGSIAALLFANGHSSIPTMLMGLCCLASVQEIKRVKEIRRSVSNMPDRWSEGVLYDPIAPRSRGQKNAYKKSYAKGLHFLKQDISPMLKTMKRNAYAKTGFSLAAIGAVSFDSSAGLLAASLLCLGLSVRQLYRQHVSKWLINHLEDRPIIHDRPLPRPHGYAFYLPTVSPLTINVPR